MLYKYEIKDELSEEEINNMISRAKTIKRNYLTFTIIKITILVILAFIFLNLVAKYIIKCIFFKEQVYMLLITYILCIIILILGRKRAMRNIALRLVSNIKEKQIIELKDDKWIYINKKDKISLNKNTINEVIEFDKYILIMIGPKFMKYIFINTPIIVPKYLFESIDEYKKFVNNIK